VLDATKGARAGKPTFMPKGDVQQLASDKPSLAAPLPNNTNRFALLQSTPQVRAGGWCCGALVVPVPHEPTSPPAPPPLMLRLLAAGCPPCAHTPTH
jgi:hypothetical protein